MSYSQKPYPNDQAEFPAPPLWLLWRERRTYNQTTHSYEASEVGQIRHYPTLQKCKKEVSPYGDMPFHTDWSIYKWEGDQYVLHYSGKAGQIKADNELFQIRVSAKREPVRDVPEDVVEATLASIMQAAS